jgi:excisionase family DNA binding protein
LVSKPKKFELKTQWINGPFCDPDDWCSLTSIREVTPSRRKVGNRDRQPVIAVEPEPNRQSLTVGEAAWLLRCHPNTIFNLIRSGELPSFNVGRKRLIARSAVEQLISGDGR